MDIALRNEFEHRFYIFRLNEATQNQDLNLSILSRMNDYHIDIALDGIKLLEPPLGNWILSALVKRASSNSLHIASDEILNVEPRALEEFQELVEFENIMVKAREKQKKLKQFQKSFLESKLREHWDKIIQHPMPRKEWCDLEISDQWKLRVYFEIEKNYYYYSHNVLYLA